MYCRLAAFVLPSMMDTLYIGCPSPIGSAAECSATTTHHDNTLQACCLCLAVHEGHLAHNGALLLNTLCLWIPLSCYPWKTLCTWQGSAAAATHTHTCTHACMHTHTIHTHTHTHTHTHACTDTHIPTHRHTNKHTHHTNTHTYAHRHRYTHTHTHTHTLNFIKEQLIVIQTMISMEEGGNFLVMARGVVRWLWHISAYFPATGLEQFFFT